MNSENIAVPLDKELPQEELAELIAFADTDCLIYDREYHDVAEYIKHHAGQRLSYICMQENGQDECLWSMVEGIDDSVQEFRFAFSEQIRQQIFYVNLVRSIETTIKSNAFVNALKHLCLKQRTCF